MFQILPTRAWEVRPRPDDVQTCPVACHPHRCGRALWGSLIQNYVAHLIICGRGNQRRQLKGPDHDIDINGGNIFREAYIMVSLLLSSDQSIYGNLVKDMQNSYTLGQNNYPRTLPKMQNLLANWQNSARKTPINPTRNLSFDQ